MDREEVYQELKNAHWEKVYNWDDVDANIDIVSRRARCSADELREMMRDIEAKYPKQKKKKPQTWRNVEFRKPCRTCGRVIGFARTRDNNLMPVNLDDYTTHWACEKPGKQ